MKKCPPGVFCMEQYSMMFVMLLCVLFLVYKLYTPSKETTTSQVIVNNSDRGIAGWLPSWPYTNQDPLLNPYAPPLRDERYMVPINVSTNIGAVDASYRQVGIMTATNAKGGPIPLMGRPLFTNRDKWQYYTMSDQQNSMKLPVSRNGRSCTNEYGCDKLYNGDTVYIEGLNEPYRVTVYDNDTIRYLPFV